MPSHPPGRTESDYTAGKSKKLNQLWLWWLDKKADDKEALVLFVSKQQQQKTKANITKADTQHYCFGDKKGPGERCWCEDNGNIKAKSSCLKYIITIENIQEP